MESEFVIAMVIAVPFILFPADFIWYLNICEKGDLYLKNSGLQINIRCLLR